MSVHNINVEETTMTPHDKLIQILFNTPQTEELIKKKQCLMKLRIKNYYYQKQKYINHFYKLLEIKERNYINYLLNDDIKTIYNKENIIITIDDMLSGVFE